MSLILIIEDNDTIRANVADYLRHGGFTPVEAATAEQGKALFASTRPDALILDLTLPDGDGVILCKDFRKQSDLPILILTARGGERDEIIGLEAGADDYIIKPFRPQALVLKVKSLIERAHPAPREVEQLGDLLVDFSARIVRRLKQEEHTSVMIELTAIEFNILRALIDHSSQVLSREELIELAYGSLPPDIFDRTIDQHIKNMRKKLGNPTLIRTVRGTGYQLGIN